MCFLRVKKKKKKKSNQITGEKMTRCSSRVRLFWKKTTHRFPMAVVGTATTGCDTGLQKRPVDGVFRWCSNGGKCLKHTVKIMSDCVFLITGRNAYSSTSKTDQKYRHTCFNAVSKQSETEQGPERSCRINTQRS